MSAPLPRRRTRGEKLWALKPEPRRDAADAFVGSLVRVTIVHRGGSSSGGSDVYAVREGRVLAVAQPAGGAGADVLVVKADGYRAQAISLATIGSIVELEGRRLEDRPPS